jgi:hypothetical protein
VSQSAPDLRIQLQRSFLRVIPGLLLLLLLISPPVASGQSFLVQGAAGLTVLDTGHNLSYGFDPGLSLSAGAGLSPTRRVTFLLEVERTHRASQLQVDARGGVFGFRGGTLILVVPQMRLSLFPQERIGPYGVLGFAAGVSRLNATELHPERTTSNVRAMVFGGGIHVPLAERLSLFGDGRVMMGAAESGEGDLLGIVSIRVGLAWRF